MKIPIKTILPNPEQPRLTFDQAELEQLAASMAIHGVINPIAVEEAGTGYILHDGERRLRAARLLGWTEIEAAVTQPLNGSGKPEHLERALVGNLQRSDLNLIEEAEGYRRLRDECGYSVSMIAKRMGTNDNRIHNRLAILELEPEIQTLLAERKLPNTPDALKALATLPSEPRIRLARKAASLRFSAKTIIRAAGKMHELLGTKQTIKGTPAVELGKVMAHGKLDLPKWNALMQIGQVPLWELVETAARRTCEMCSLRPMASKSTCGQCPLPLALAQMIDISNRSKIQSKSSVPLCKK